MEWSLKLHPFEDLPMRSLSRRSFTGLLLVGAILPKAFAAPNKKLIEVWKGPTCGCCIDWIKHLEANGLSVKSYDTGNHDMRAKLGLPVQYGSCHTALIDGYVIEGHVPARDIGRLLRERPDGIGLAVPAMPVGSPGMDGPEYRGRKDPYDVLLVRRDGKATVFQTYR
jgi:hypothetical protein